MLLLLLLLLLVSVGGLNSASRSMSKSEEDIL
jgi:hypothetical protein